MGVKCGHCLFTEYTAGSKRRDWQGWWCTVHSVRTTSTMRECQRGERESSLKMPVQESNHG